ncbi:MAG: T9SS type A sorting domain-containing protein [Bacteroidia bacterium]|jgi:hypothetical protein|nr:T9SS type A sorting domain-containing protein [Bacteroidia bacterium]
MIFRAFPIIVLICFANSSSFAQFFGILTRYPQNNYQCILEFPKDNKHRVLNWVYSSQDQLYKSQILVYNPDFTFFDSINLLRNLIPISVEPIYESNRYLWPAVFTDSSTFNPSIQQFVVLETDTSYHFVDLHKMGALTFSAIQPFNIINIGSSYYTGFTDFLTSSSKIYKLNAQLIKTDSIALNAKINSLSVQNNFLLISGIGFPCSNVNGNFQKASLDTNFQFVDCFTLKNLIVNTGPCTQTVGIWPYANSLIFTLSNTKCFALGNYDIIYNAVCDDWYGMVNSVLDNNNVILQTNFISSSFTNTSYMDYSISHWCFKNNKILTVGIEGHNFQIGSSISGQPQTTKFVINKFDTLGNLIWTKKHGGDMYYRSKSIKYTLDGGILIAGMRYDSSNHALPVGVMESFLLKLDSNGNFSPVLIPEVGAKLDKIKCYPNPTSNKLHFDLPLEQEISLCIFDLFGKEVLRENFIKSNQPIDVEGLSTGLYIYKVTHNQKQYSGKFIKSGD